MVPIEGRVYSHLLLEHAGKLFAKHVLTVIMCLISRLLRLKHACRDRDAPGVDPLAVLSPRRVRRARSHPFMVHRRVRRARSILVVLPRRVPHKVPRGVSTADGHLFSLGPRWAAHRARGKCSYRERYASYDDVWMILCFVRCLYDIVLDTMFG